MEASLKKYYRSWLQGHENDPLTPILLTCITYFQKSELEDNLYQMLKTAIEQGKLKFEDPWHCETMTRFHCMKCLKLLREKGCPWDKQTFNMVVKYGNVDDIKWCFEQSCPIDVSEVCDHVIAGDKSENIKLICQHGNLSRDLQKKLELHEIICDYMGNPMHSFEFAYEHDLLKLDENLTRAAARYNRLDVLNYLIDRKCPVDTSAYYAALEAGHLEIVVFLETILQ